MGIQNTNSKLKIFSLNSNKELAEQIAEQVGLPLGKSS
ncbi:ribose-phosphate pyrophosphokinase, partial [Bacillus sp. SIMBA_161]